MQKPERILLYTKKKERKETTTGTKENRLRLTLMNGYYCYSNERGKQFNSQKFSFSLFFLSFVESATSPNTYTWLTWRVCVCVYMTCRPSKFIQNEQYHEYFMGKVSQKTCICTISVRSLPKTKSTLTE